MSIADNYLRIGDFVTLKFSKYNGYISSDGILIEDICISSNPHCFEDHIFQVFIQLQYSATNEYEEFVGNYPGDINNIEDPSTKKHLEALIRGKMNELKMNESFMKLKTGNRVLFGEVVQLFHVKSKKFLTVVTNEVARDERENLLVRLDSEGNTRSWIQLLPRFKIDREGDKISNNTEILLKVSERSGEFVHCSEKRPPSGRAREVNSSLDEATPWKISIYQRSTDMADPSLLLMGEIVYLRDPETQSLMMPISKPMNLEVEKPPPKKKDDDDGSHIESASLSRYPSIEEATSASYDQSEEDEEDVLSVSSLEEFVQESGEIVLKPHHEFHLDSNSLWVMESKVFSKGGSLSLQTDHVHFRHLNTGKYLTTYDVENVQNEFVNFKLVDKPTDKYSLFSVSELHTNREHLSNSKAIQLKQGHLYLERGELSDRHKVYKCHCGHSKIRATNLIINRFIDDEETDKQSTNDVRPGILDIFVGKSTERLLDKFLMMTKIPSRNSTRDFSIWPKADSSDRVMFSLMIERIVLFVQGFPILFDPSSHGSFIPSPATCHKRQRLFREQGILRCVLTMLNILSPISERALLAEEEDFCLAEESLIAMGKEVISECLKLLYELVKGNSVNQMHIADYMLVVLVHVSTDPVAALVAQEMLSSNRDLQETKIGFDEISIFAEKMRESQMSSMYLNLLRSCCSCLGHGVPRNQLTVEDVIFDKFQDLVMLVSASHDKLQSGIEWTSSSSLYFPDTSNNTTSFLGLGSPTKTTSSVHMGSSGSMLGAELFDVGLPNLYLTWSNSSPKYSPSVLFDKSKVIITEVFRHLPASVICASGAITLTKSKNNASSSEIRRSVAEYFVAQLYLVAEMCLDRNYTVMMHMETLFPYEVLATMMKMDIHDGVKSAAACVVANLYVDRDPQLATSLPRLTRTWTDLTKQTKVLLVSVDPQFSSHFGIIQCIISEDIRRMRGKIFPQYSLSYLQLLLKLIEFNFYGSLERLKDIIDPLIMTLKRDDLEVESNTDITATITKGTRRASVASRRKSMELNKNIAPTIIDDAIKSLDKLDNSVEEVRDPLTERIFRLLESNSAIITVTIFAVLATGGRVAILFLGLNGFYCSLYELLVFAIFALEIVMRVSLYFVLRNPVMPLISSPLLYVDVVFLVLSILQISLEIFGSIGSYVMIIRVGRAVKFLLDFRASSMVETMVNMTSSTTQWVEPLRFRKTSETSLIVMEKIVEILSRIQLLIEDRNISLLLHKFHGLQEKNTEFAPTDVESVFLEVLQDSGDLQVSNNEYDSIYLDLLMYKNKALVQRVLDVLMAYHTSKQTLLTNCLKLQLIVSGKRESQFFKLEKIVTQLKRDADTHAVWGKLNDENDKKINKRVYKALEDLLESCRRFREVLRFDEPYEPDNIIQDMLRNLGCFELCMKILGLMSSIDSNETMSIPNKNTRNLALNCNNLLYWLILDNSSNQTLAFAHLSFFVKMIDERINSHKIIYAMFSNNEHLIKSVPKQFITDFVSLICNSGRFPQYLSLLYSVTSAGEKNVIENQYEVIRQISAPENQKKILLYFVPNSHPDYNKKVKAMLPFLNKKDVAVDELPADLQYHLDLLQVLSQCSVGTANMTTIEAKIQAMFFFVDVVNAILDPNCILLAKIRLALFLYNSMIDVEMRLPSLKDAACIWKYLESMVEIFEFARDELRQIEKNGWQASTSNRQKIEYMLSCAMNIHGYFSLYFDKSIFRPELGHATIGVERINMKEQHAYYLMKVLYDKIRLIYEMRSPLLAKQHHDALFAAMKSLNDASPDKIVASVEDLHSELFHDIQINENDVSLHSQEYKIFSRFSTYLENSEMVKSISKDQIQDFIKCLEKIPWRYENAHSDIRFEDLLHRLIAHMRSCIKIVVHGDETTKFIDTRCTATSKWLIIVFRTMIENRWGMTIDDRDDLGGEEQDEASEKLVEALNNANATELCLDLIARGIDIDLQSEAIKLLVGMLFHEGGSLLVQTTINQHLNKSGSELFFLHIRYIIQNLISWHRWHGVITLEEGTDPDIPSEIILVRCLQLMCEGHYEPNQNILREQPNNTISINILDDMVEYLQALDNIKCRTSTAAALSVCALVLEVIQGPCQGNQDYFALKTELIETLNRKMRHSAINDCDEGEEVELKKSVIDIFQGLMEGQAKRTAIYERILSVIHLDVLQLLCTPDKSDGEEDDEERVALQTESLVVMQMLSDYRPSIKDELGTDVDISSLVGDTVACVEVVWRGELQRRFFHVPDICRDLAKVTKDQFIADVDRSSPENKLYGLLEASHEMYREVLHQQILKSLNIASIFSRQNQDRVSWATFFVAFLINVLFITFYKTNIIDCPSSFPNKTTLYDATLGVCSEITIDKTVDTVVLVLNVILCFLALFTLIIYWVVRLPINFQSHQEEEKGLLYSVVMTAMDFQTLYYVVFILLSALGFYQHVILTFLLLDIIIKSPLAQAVLNAAYKPKKTIIMTMILTFILIYIWSFFAFFMNDNSSNFIDYYNMSSLWNVFKDFFRYGSPYGGVSDLVVTIVDWRYISDVIFFAVCFIMWNIVKGITIDTFVELRTDLEARIQDTEDVCFICGIEKNVFNRALDREAFDIHIKKDQNLWNYVYFIMYIWEQDKDDDDGLETFVRKCINNKDLSWFPMNKAIRLAEHQQNEENEGLKFEFKKSLQQLDDAFLAKIGSLKENLARSVARVEHVMSADSNTILPSRRRLRTNSVITNRASSSARSIKESDVSVDIVNDNDLVVPITKDLEEESNAPKELPRKLRLMISKISGLILPKELLSTLSCRVTSDYGESVLSPSSIDFYDDNISESFVEMHSRLLRRNVDIPYNVRLPCSNDPIIDTLVADEIDDASIGSNASSQIFMNHGGVVTFDKHTARAVVYNGADIQDSMEASYFIVRIQIVCSHSPSTSPPRSPRSPRVNEGNPNALAVFVGAVYVPLSALFTAAQNSGVLEATFYQNSVLVPGLRHSCSIHLLAELTESDDKDDVSTGSQ